ncbi:MAG: hypothetical protein ABWZ52_02030 [Acidimicrobiales bacterium]
MDLWYPPEDEAPLLEWWTPLLLAASAGRRERVPWPIHLDDFMLMGRVDRGSRPSVWIYKHRDSRRELNVDSTGQAYKFSRTPNAAGYGRFTACDIRTAVHQADLPRFVEAVWFDEPPLKALPPWPGSDREAPDVEEPPPVSPSAAHPTRRRPRPGARRGHLTLIRGGRAAG